MPWLGATNRSLSQFQVGIDWTQPLPSTITVTQDASFSLTPYLRNAGVGELVRLANTSCGDSVTSSALPAGVTLVNTPGAQALTATGTATITAASGVVFSAQGIAADWTSRTAGSTFNTNFTYKDAAQSVPIASDADLIGTFFTVQGPAGSANVHWDQTHKLSGAGSLRLSMPAASAGTYTSCGLTWDGIGALTKNTSLHQFYVQFSVYVDPVYCGFYYGDINNWGGKLALVMSPETSFASSEILIRRDPRPGGFLNGYRYTPSGGATYYGLVWGSQGSDKTTYNFLDAGSPTVSSQQTLRQRYGTDSATIPSGSSGDLFGTNADYQWVPRLVSGGWTYITMYIDQVNQVVKYWIAPWGQAPVLSMGAMNANIASVGTNDPSGNPKPIYTGMQLLNYPNTATYWPVSDTFICYGEVIATTSQPTFPGGYPLPFPGTTTPTGYPPSGGVEQ